ncbi:MAG: sensor histidine kinase [Brotaphodocola sp.]
MKLKDYSMRIKKQTAVLLHLIFLTLAVAGISFMYLNTQIGSGINWMLNRNYEDSEAFEAQFQEDLDDIFAYISYRDVFETDGMLDLSREMFSVSRENGPEIIYTLEEVLRYAKSQGFYLDDDFHVVNDMFIYGDASTAKDQYVNWRAYDPDATLSEPGDAYTSLLELCKEVLSCLSKYYTVYYGMLSDPSNLYFQVVYGDEDEEPVIYSNAEDMSIEELRSLGRYCYLTSDSILIETNLEQIPSNLTISMEENNFYDTENYYLIAAVDTSYPADDKYASAALDYHQIRRRALEGLLALSIGCIGCLVTLFYLAQVSGYRTDDPDSLYLHDYDLITTESWIALSVVCTMFMLFLGEKIGYKLLHLLLHSYTWDFAEKMMQAVIVYLCILLSLFSLLRRYKNHQLWENSLANHLLQDIDEYFTNRPFTHMLLWHYSCFVGAHILGITLIVTLFGVFRYSLAKLLILLICAGLVVLDYRTFRRLFRTASQEDRIADAIEKIAGGDTSYQMDIKGLDGKKLNIARMINSIGTGLERALQEKVKSERFKADLITNVSHDIKTPLTSIINYVDLLKREHIPNEKVQEYLNVLDQKSQRLKTLTEDLVEASKASSGNLKLEMTRLDLVEMIWQTNGEFEEKYETRHLTLVSDLPNESMMIEADGRRLWRVLENLYNNAFKYAMENSRVYTEVKRENDFAYFIIKNVSENPLNISSDELTERFVRGDVSRTTEGSGLGLSIAQSLTKLQGGTFELFIDGDLFKARIGFPIREKKQNTEETAEES